MIFTELPPIHHLPSPTPSYHYAESPLDTHMSWPMSKSDPKPIFSFSPVPNANAATAPTSSTAPFTSSRETNPSTTTSSRSKSTATYAHRYQATLTNPLNNTPQPRTSISPHARNNRRTAFLNRVKADRDEGRFENRADQFMKLEHDAERSVWGEEMGRTAEGIMRGMDVDGYDYEDGEGEGVGGDDERTLDELISQEEAEAMEMEMGLLEEKNQDHGHGQGLGQSQVQGQTKIADFGSFSDDEYDHLFMDLAGQQGQGMDMSSG